MIVVAVPVVERLCCRPAPAGLGGLIALVEGVETSFPLAEMRVRTSIVGDCARTVVQQRFENPHAQPLEAVHLFPLPEDGAVVSLVLKAGETVVKGICKEKEQAEREFAAAREAGHRAALLTSERDDVHTLRVTRIPAGEEIRVEIVVVERLQRVDGQYRWRFPTVVAPRYLPGTAVSHDGPGVLPATDRVPDADHLQPPLRLQGGTKLDLEVEIEGPVRNLQCAQHAFSIELGTTLRVAPSASATLDRDFVLAFSTAAADRIVSRAWTDGSYTLLTVEPPAVAMPQTLPRDAIFVVDISGSMGNVKMGAAKRALAAAVRGLGDGDRFRILGFDDQLLPMSADLLPFDAVHLERADAFIESLCARGGTEMLPAIIDALKGDRPAGRARSVLFITDGQAWNEAELTAAVANRCQGARFFTFGIDTAVNGALLGRLARVGGGTCELATPSDDIEEALLNLEARFGNPVLEGVHVEGLQGARLVKSPVFTGRPATLLFEGAPDTLQVVGIGAAGEVRFTVTPKRTGFGLGQLWARERITALQDRLMLKPFEEEALRPEILRIALAHGVVSKFTAFVAVDQGRVVAGPLKEVVQPVEPVAQWGMRSRPQSAAPMSPSPSRSRSRATLSPGAPPSSPAPKFGEVEGEGAPSLSLAGVDAGRLARSQDADGSFGGDVLRTVAALLTLLVLGHTRRTGARRRAVAKAAEWLAGRSEPLAQTALVVLAQAEAGQPVVPSPEWSGLYAAGAEGAALEAALA